MKLNKLIGSSVVAMLAFVAVSFVAADAQARSMCCCGPVTWTYQNEYVCNQPGGFFASTSKAACKNNTGPYKCAEGVKPTHCVTPLNITIACDPNPKRPGKSALTGLGTIAVTGPNAEINKDLGELNVEEFPRLHIEE